MKKVVIFKNIYLYIAFLVIMFSPLCVKAEALTYNEASNMVQEVMKQYYVRGPYFQYNYAKAEYYNLDPEEGTLQDNKYTVCAGFTHNVYNQAFGIKGPTTYMSGENTFKENAFPQYNYHIVYAAQHAYQKIKNKTIKDDGNLLLYYQSNVNTKDIGGDGKGRDREIVKYVYGDTNTSSDEGDFETLVKNVKPGDLVVFSGHALIVYDSVDTNGDGKKDDILILNATGGGNEIASRIASTSSLYYSAFPSTRKGSDILTLEKEGVFELILMSQQPRFVSSGVLKCKNSGSNAVDECAVVRPFYKDSSGNAVFNFQQNVDKSSDAVKKTTIRTKYSGLLIEKTVSKGDNNSVYIGDELTYTIKVTNKSYVAKDNVTYPQFTINEVLDSNVECVDCTSQGWTVSGSNITKTITTKLAPSESVELKYTVKINNDLDVVGETIQSVGSFYDSSQNKGLLTTGTVKNLVIPKVENLKESYSSCYNKNKSSYSGLTLIEKVYTCATGTNYNFSKFSFSSLFTKTGTTKTNGTINFNGSLDTNHTRFKNMILNNYFSGLMENDGTYYLPRFTSKSATRAENINAIDFKEGDILIYDIYNSQYTYEEGLYAYVYIDGLFVGVNGSGYTLRNSFSPTYHTYDYWNDNGYENKLTVASSLYVSEWTSLSSAERKFVHYQSLYGKDNYIILRPELIIKETAKIEVSSNPTKTSYIQNKDSLDLTGGKIKVSYNDGTSETINMNSSGVSVTGFSNSTVGAKTLTVTYSGKTTTFTVNVVKQTSLKDSFTNAGFKIKSNYVHGFTLKQKLSNIKSKINVDFTYDSDKIIGTGFQFKYSSETYTAVVYGDLNGDGEINSADLFRMRQHLLETNILTGAYKEAATIAGGTTINSADLFRLRQHLLEQNLIVQ